MMSRKQLSQKREQLDDDGYQNLVGAVAGGFEVAVGGFSSRQTAKAKKSHLETALTNDQ